MRANQQKMRRAGFLLPWGFRPLGPGPAPSSIVIAGHNCSCACTLRLQSAGARSWLLQLQVVRAIVAGCYNCRWSLPLKLVRTAAVESVATTEVGCCNCASRWPPPPGASAFVHCSCWPQLQLDLHLAIVVGSCTCTADGPLGGTEGANAHV